MIRLKENPHDPVRWKRAIDIAEWSGDICRIREAYDGLLKQYPNTVSAQTAYLQHFVKSFATRRDAKELFNRFLTVSPFIELWDFYLSYVRRINPLSSLSSRQTVLEAYEFATKNIGHDHNSGPMWTEYIQFLDGGEGLDAEKVQALRSTYHRCLQIPLKNVVSLWVQYEAFEMGLNKIIAQKLLSDLLPAHVQARTVLHQLTIHLERLGLNAHHPRIFLPAPATFSEPERQLVGQWKVYLRWEEGNPLGIPDQHSALLTSRIQMAYRKAVIRMRYYPEIWFMAYLWTTSVGRTGEGLAILKAGLEANPDSFALTYAYAELLEKKKDPRDFTEIHIVYERLLRVLRVELERLTAAASESPDYDNLEWVPADPPTKEGVAERKRNQEDLLEFKKQYSNAWINYMRFARRAQGHEARRDVFRKARKDEYVGWEVYEAAGESSAFSMTEYRCNLTDGRMVAARIFETGMEKYSSDATYILSYLGFLLMVNDENNARALFERVIGTFTPQEAKPIWEHWSRSQYQYDDLEAVLELERRMGEVYRNDPLIKRFAQRHIYHSIDAIADHDLGFAKTRKLTNGNTNGNRTPNVVQGAAPSPNKRPPPLDDDQRRGTDYKRPRLDDSNRDRVQRHSRLPSAERDRPLLPRLPAILHSFVSQLPPRETFDGPIFNTDSLIDKLRTVVIPSSASRAQSTLSEPRTTGPLPLDYGPYHGPGSQRTRGGGK
ncbi:Suf-domain-containing protein [Mycena alexandri]|uniref:mRNA 3'-end-processing protein RNA14 n=1 Tax=Mycena alexandri TaxID=1745969 RepID=A0AAD6X1N5_9AGAR|nr:Suf-domain-containing protein [Mycena alexandri]